jgi:ATP-dependent DNA ligase
MELAGQDVRPEPLEERRKRLAKLLSRRTKAMRDGVQLRAAITGDGAAIFRHACWMDLESIVSKRIGARQAQRGGGVWRFSPQPFGDRCDRCSAAAFGLLGPALSWVA